MLPEDSAHHGVHVLRIRTGDDITLFNGRGGEYAARVASIQRLKVLVDVHSRGVFSYQPRIVPKNRIGVTSPGS